MLGATKLLIGALVGALVLGSGAYWYGLHRGKIAGYSQRVAEQAIADGKAEIARKGDDARIQAMDDYELCVLGLRSNGMPVDACEQLRGVRAE